MSAVATIHATTESASTDLLAPATAGLAPSSVEQLRALFVPFLDKAREWETRAQAIVVTDETDTRSMKFARESRLALREIRCSVEHARKAAKADALSRGKAIDGIANAIKGIIEPIEARLLHAETFGERAEEARRDKVREARRESLRAHGADPTTFADVGAMSDDAWAATLETVRLAHEAKIEATKQAEAIRVEAERLAAAARETARVAAVKAEAERVERERLQVEENARLRAEAAEREAAARLEREAAAAAKAAAEASARAEREAIEAKARADREAAEAETRKAREEADRAAAELAAERAAAAKAATERDAAEAARLAAEADAKKPTKAKCAVLVAALTSIAAWGEGLETADEPHAAAKARHALQAVGLGV